jgi:hypothetical protein
LQQKGASMGSKRLQNNLLEGPDYFIILFGAFFVAFFAFFAIQLLLRFFVARARKEYSLQSRPVPSVYGQGMHVSSGIQGKRSARGYFGASVAKVPP